METLNVRQIKCVITAIILATTNMAAPVEGDAPTYSPLASAARPQSDPSVKKDAPVPPVESGPVANIVLTFEVYQLSQADGSALIQENATDEARHDRALELVKSGQASFDAVLCGVVRSGQQVVVEQVNPVCRLDKSYFPSGGNFKFGMWMSVNCIFPPEPSKPSTAQPNRREIDSNDECITSPPSA